jgi:histidine kinase
MRARIFLIVQKVFVESLVANKTLYYSLTEERWVWDINNLLGTRITDSAAQLLMKAIDTLPDPTRQALRLLSCLGSKADKTTLLMLEDVFAEKNGGVGLSDALAVAISKNILEKNENGYRFSHDLIEQNVYDAMVQSDASDYHMLIGEALVLKDNTENRTTLRPLSFIAIDQINTAMWTRSWDEYSFKFAALNLKAAEASMGLSDFDAAFAYVEHGLFCLWNHHWEEETYDLNLGLEQIGSRACFAIADYEKMEDWVEDVMKHADSLGDRLPTQLLWIEYLGASGKVTEAIDRLVLTT